MAHELSALDAVRLLCNAIQMVQHEDREKEGLTPACRDAGELMVQDALSYLAYGDIAGARECIGTYERWLKTGEAPWPYGAGEGRDEDNDEGES